MEDEVDEGLEEEDAMAMAVGPLRGGDERGEGGEVWFGVCSGSNEWLAESVVYIVACLLAALLSDVQKDRKLVKSKKKKKIEMAKWDMLRGRGHQHSKV